MILSGLYAFSGALLRGNSGRAVLGLCRSVIKFLRKAVDGLQGRRGLGGELYQCRAPDKELRRVFSFESPGRSLSSLVSSSNNFKR
jgi:hypothetical protein